MKQFYYMTVFPMEALIASQLEPEAFGAYMSVGARKGSAEALIFVQLNEAVGPFAWDIARARCVSHADGSPKHSLYLSIYRVLENVPLSSLGSLFLVTRDGRTLELPQSSWDRSSPNLPANWDGVGLYKELCPVQPLVVSTMKPAAYGYFMTNPSNRIHLPALLFTDLRLPCDLEAPYARHPSGQVYDQNLEHLKSCIDEVRQKTEKGTKIVDRTYFPQFSYNLINSGVFLSQGDNTLFWSMPDLQTIKESNYDWGRSANML